MLLAKWILFLIVGKVVIHVWQQFQLPTSLKRFVWLAKLHDCDLCSGVWIYTILSLFLGVDLLSVTIFEYVPLVSEIVTGILVSWIVHIFTLGWHAKYDVVVI
jgi:hypothetical protein